ncbi:MAG: hypothetical protein ACFE95_06065 [Candidatus Hodarchaeota archaeon]
MKTQRTLNRRILGPYRISHHPLCSNFEDHIYLVKGTKICRGCVMQYSGMIFSFVIIGIGSLYEVWSGLTEIQIGFTLYILIIPTFLTAFIIESRMIKDIARLLLGASFTVAFLLLIFTPDWIIKVWILLNFIPGYIYLNKRRAKKNNEICSTCQERHNIPFCSGYQIYTDREKIFMSQATHGGIKDPFALPPDQLEE